HLAHLGQTLPRRLAGPTLPAGMSHAGAVAKAQPSEVMRRTHQAIELEFYESVCHDTDSMPLSRCHSCPVLARAANESPVWRGHGQEVHRGQPGGPRLTRNGAALGSLLHPCAPTGVFLLAVGCLRGAALGGSRGPLPRRS